MTQKKRCLFVACGPSLKHAMEYLTYGKLVTLNRAIEAFDKVDLAFIGTPGKIKEMAGEYHRAKRLIPLFIKKQLHPFTLPEGKLVRWLPAPKTKHEPKGGYEILRSHVAAGNILGRAGAALYHLQRMGYREIWLFGHDGGHNRSSVLGMKSSARGYDKSRFCTEEVAKLLKLSVYFWPDHPPGW